MGSEMCIRDSPICRTAELHKLVKRRALSGLSGLYMTGAMLDFVYEAFPARIVFGSGKVALIGEEADRLKASSVLLVCTNSQLAVADQVSDLLGRRVTVGSTEP